MIYLNLWHHDSVWSRDGHENMHFFLINVGKKGVQKNLILWRALIGIRNQIFISHYNLVLIFKESVDNIANMLYCLCSRYQLVNWSVQWWCSAESNIFCLSWFPKLEQSPLSFWFEASNTSSALPPGPNYCQNQIQSYGYPSGNRNGYPQKFRLTNSIWNLTLKW